MAPPLAARRLLEANLCHRSTTILTMGDVDDDDRHLPDESAAEADRIGTLRSLVFLESLEGTDGGLTSLPPCPRVSETRKLLAWQTSDSLSRPIVHSHDNCDVGGHAYRSVEAWRGSHRQLSHSRAVLPRSRSSRDSGSRQLTCHPESIHST